MKLASMLLLGALVVGGKALSSPTRDAAPGSLTDAPYRDGLFLGRLAAQRGAPNLPSLGRWSSAEDRAHFVLGYEQAYLETAGASARVACAPNKST